MTFPVNKSSLSFSDHLTDNPGDDNSELPFCTEDSIAECLSYLNQVSIVLLLHELICSVLCRQFVTEISC